MNILPIDSEWKRRIKWAEKQQKIRKLSVKPRNKRGKNDPKIHSVQED